MRVPRNHRAARRNRALALIGAAVVLTGTAACTGDKSTPPAAGTPKTSVRPNTPVTPTTPGALGPCRTTMNDVMHIGDQLTTDATAKNQANLATDARTVGDRFDADAAAITDQDAKKGAQQLALFYRALGDSAKTGKAPDVKTMVPQVQSAVTALGKCASAEG